MRVATEVRKKVNNLDFGTILKYSDFKEYSKQSIALSKILSRLVKENKLERIEKGVFYKPKKSKFGKITPSVLDIIKKELYIENETIGYITGKNLYNKLGLTTQISNIVEIATNKRKSSKTISGRKIKFIQIYAKISTENIKLLQFLDVLKNIKKIPDSNINETYKIMRYKISNLDNIEIQRIMNIALDYSPQTRALLGSILEEVSKIKLDILEESLNNLTKFNLNIKEKINKKRWNIK